MMSADYAGELSVVQFLSKNVAVGSGTATVAGVDLKDFIGTMKIVLTYAEQNGLNPNLAISFLDSADNTTFAAIAAPSIVAQTATATQVVSAQLDTRAVQRYVQAKHLQTGTTTTCAVSVVGIGLKQVA